MRFRRPTEFVSGLGCRMPCCTYTNAWHAAPHQATKPGYQRKHRGTLYRTSLVLAVCLARFEGPTQHTRSTSYAPGTRAVVSEQGCRVVCRLAKMACKCTSSAYSWSVKQSGCVDIVKHALRQHTSQRMMQPPTSFTANVHTAAPCNRPHCYIKQVSSNA
jgi:hypothetical protein